MADLNKGITKLSAVSTRYLQMIEEMEREEKENTDDLSDLLNTSLYNRVLNRIKNEDELQKKIIDDESANIKDVTEVIIDDSDDLCFQPATANLSFMCDSFQKEFDASEPSVISNLETENIFEDSSSYFSGSSLFSPPNKRRKHQEKTFFNAIINEKSILSDSLFKQEEPLKNLSFMPSKDQSVNFLNTLSDFREPMPKFEVNLSSSSSKISEQINDQEADEEMSSFLKTNEKISNLSDLSHFGEPSRKSFQANNATFVIEKENSKENISNKTKATINTFYEAPCLLDTEKIENFYKKAKFDDWESMINSVGDLMEPSIDYITYRLNCMKSLTVGRVDESLEYDNSDEFHCNFINQTDEEIEESFEKGKFVCSTPEESYIAEKNENWETDPLNVGFLKYLSIQCNNTNVEPQDDQNDDENTTKSFVVNKDTTANNNIWSDITHVSCSVPMNQEENNEPVFDITTLFDLNKKDDSGVNSNNDVQANNNDENDEFNDYSRYELMISILNEGDNHFEKTPVDLQETLKIIQSRKAAIMAQIEIIISGLIKSLADQQPMKLNLHKIKKWNECKYESNILSQKETTLNIKSLSFENKNTERTFTIVIHLLGEIHKMLCMNTTCTKRELYYRDVELMNNQTCVNKAIDEICDLLNVQCWELGILSTSKGLVAGDLKITTDEDEVIDYSMINSVPQKPSAIKEMSSDAEYVLVVEKDTVFTRLMEDNIMEKIGSKIILITAKGYPDINTRVLLKKIEVELCIPIYIIVDGDPFGIDIMCTYKYGSLQMINFSQQLAISKMEWIGIHPTDIEKLDITRTELTDADLKKINELMKRPYMNENVKKELEHLKTRGLKAEIESIYHFSIDFLVHDYIPGKIAMIANPMQQIIQESNFARENLL